MHDPVCSLSILGSSCLGLSVRVHVSSACLLPPPQAWLVLILWAPPEQAEHILPSRPLCPAALLPVTSMALRCACLTWLGGPGSAPVVLGARTQHALSKWKRLPSHAAGSLFFTDFLLTIFPLFHSALVIATVFDRNINCRRAASVSFLILFLFLTVWMGSEPCPALLSRPRTRGRCPCMVPRKPLSRAPAHISSQFQGEGSGL